MFLQPEKQQGSTTFAFIVETIDYYRDTEISMESLRTGKFHFGPRACFLWRDGEVEVNKSTEYTARDRYEPKEVHDEASLFKPQPDDHVHVINQNVRRTLSDEDELASTREMERLMFLDISTVPSPRRSSESNPYITPVCVVGNQKFPITLNPTHAVPDLFPNHFGPESFDRHSVKEKTGLVGRLPIAWACSPFRA